ncbi:MAG: hypothetical protein WCK63_15545 [Betaproteobacteria bacterium]
MNPKVSPSDEELLQRVDEVLHYIWDPIGVSGVPEARDEYRTYSPQVFSLLKNSASVEKVAQYLNSVATDRMGLQANPTNDRETAEVLVNWVEFLRERRA